MKKVLITTLFFLSLFILSCTKNNNNITLLNVSYDPTRELYKQYNQLFTNYWLKKNNQKIKINQSHGGSGKQALMVMEGLKADVVTLALAGDIDILNKKKQLLNPSWKKLLPSNSTPYTSTIVFLVRKGNPKNIKDWDSLINSNIKVITPNPKTSGAARWSFLAAWVYGKYKYHDEKSIFEFVKRIYQNVPILDTGARGATISFTKRKLGDVLLTWENEAYLILQQDGGDEYEIITPSISILCEPSVAVVDSIAKEKGTETLAKEYLKYLYSDDAQRLIAKNYYRPSNKRILDEFKDKFQELKLVSIDKEFGGWNMVQNKFFNDGGIFDQFYNK